MFGKIYFLLDKMFVKNAYKVYKIHKIQKNVTKHPIKYPKTKSKSKLILKRTDLDRKKYLNIIKPYISCIN